MRIRIKPLHLVSSAIALLCVSLWPGASPPATLYLWQNPPGAVGREEQDKPRLTAFLPARQNPAATAIIVAPGGGYGMLTTNEGEPVARWLNQAGITAFVLQYRLGPRYNYPAQQEDILRALRQLRAHAGEYRINPAHIGILGFSAGGHLATIAATRFDHGDPQSPDPVERLDSRPDFTLLGYPAITMMPPLANEISVRNLGIGASPETRRLLSCEQQVRKDTPPAFLFHAAQDDIVPAAHAIMYYQALKIAGIPVEIHIYPAQGHGFGLAENNPTLGAWKGQALHWLKTQGFLQ